MNAYLRSFSSNYKYLNFEDVVFDIKIGVKNEVQIVSFKTKDKYLYVNAEGVSFADEENGENVSGHLIQLTPIIYDVSEDPIPWYSIEYFQHPKYWCAHLVIPFTYSQDELDDDDCNMFHPIVLDNGHSYVISYIPDNMAFPLDIMEEVDLEIE